VRFGALLIPDAGWPELRSRAVRAEELGLETVWIDDHLVSPARTHRAWLDSWTSLGALAACTERVKLGTLVSNVALRTPVMLARHAATLHQISGGRVDLGIGAGYAATDHAAGGTDTWGRVERVARFDEAAGLVRALLQGGPVTETGGYYPVDDVQLVDPDGELAPPRITVAAHDRRSLGVVARHGDAWNSFGGWDLSSDDLLRVTRDRNRWLDDECQAVGRDPATVGRSLLAGRPAVTPDPIWSSVDALEDFLGRYRDAGIDEMAFYFPPEVMYREGCDSEVTRQAFAEVLPRWRSVGASPEAPAKA
jgi:alkanesulfonate monooxygenase SsuD/methylene tetrahydromethanopterin reductase-like flavin-dependent oxidoreductase (luciferase family)